MGRVGPQKTFKAQHLSSPFLHTVKQSNCTAAKAWDIYSETTSYIALEGGEDGRCETRHKPLRWDRSVCACYNRRKLYRPSMATCFRCGNWIATTLCPQTPRLVNGLSYTGLRAVVAENTVARMQTKQLHLWARKTRAN